MKKLQAKLGNRYASSEVWTYVNPILLMGEMGIESDSLKFKFGDGVSPWRNLPYASAANVEEIVNEVIIALPKYNGEVEDVI